MQTDDKIKPGDKIGRYLLEKPLGEGAMSVVFVARHPQLEPRVALKILRREVSSDKQYADRFLEDARAAATLNHPNIVGVKDFDTADGSPFIVMELVDGWSLDQWLKEKGKLEVRDAARVARDIALGLGAAHASKIVHRDVKPSNVLMDNKTGAAKLTDFGAAKRDRPEDQQLTAHGQTIGTPRYMAPEQVHGEPVDPRADLWALGATLFEMLAGQPAFSATSLPRLYQAIVAEDPPKLVSLRPDVPPELASLVSRLLSKSRVARPDTADEVAEALLPFAKPGVTAATSTLATLLPPPSALKSTSAVSLAGAGGAGRKMIIGRAAAASLVAAALTGMLGVGGWSIWSTSTALPVNASIAVLPFDNLGGDEQTGRLAAGMTEDLITELSRFRALDVISRDATLAYKDKAVDVRQVGQLLGVLYILDGAIQRQGERVRISTRLIDTKDARDVWSERWDRPTDDVFALQSELAEAVASRIASPYSGEITAADRDTAKRKPPKSLTAYDLYLLGMEAQGRATRESLNAAITLLQRSLAVDPSFARAWTGLAVTYAGLSEMDGYPAELEQARESAARKAVMLDPADAGAHATLATYYMDTGDAARAEGEFDKALRLNPGSADLLSIYAGWASNFGKPEAGVAAAERAMRLNPETPAWATYNFAYANFLAGRYDDALHMFDRMPADTYTPSAYIYRAATLGALGRTDAAMKAVTLALANDPGVSIEKFADEMASNNVERERLIDTMRAASFPVCASEADLKAKPDLIRLPECVTT